LDTLGYNYKYERRKTMEQPLREYTRIYSPFSLYSLGVEAELRTRHSCDWNYWLRDDGRIVAREFLSRAWIIHAKESKEG
jgi:hypothetical protein